MTPHAIQAERDRVVREEVERASFDYDYPDGLNLKPGSELHDFIRDEMLERCRASRALTDKAKVEWQRLDYNLSAYVPMKEAESVVKQNDWRKPVAIVIPMTFAALETFLTYMTSAFLSGPIHRYKGHGSLERVVGAALLERVVRRQSVWFKERLKLTTSWRDAFVYGAGIVSPQWRKHRGTRHEDIEVSAILAELLRADMPDLRRGDLIRQATEAVLYEGSCLENWDPYRLILDPNVPINELQRSEFIGVVRPTNAMELLEQEGDPEERRFNGRYVRILAAKGMGRSEFFDETETGRGRRLDTESAHQNLKEFQSSAVHEITEIIRLIPKEWGLGDSDRPEKWVISLAADTVVTQCQPLGLDHHMLPVAAAAPSTTGYDTLPVSHLATTYGLQQTIDWWVKSRIENVRKSLNDMFVFNPAYIEIEDMKHTGPGKLIRLTQAAFGQTNIDQYIKQLDVRDTTVNHPRDITFFIELFRQANGMQDITMGNLSGMPERPTAQGIQAAQTGALSRLQYIAGMVASQQMQDLGYQLAHNTLQFMDERMTVEILGDYEQQIRQLYGIPGDQNDLEVGPLDLSPYFDVVPHDGAIPGTENVQAWTQIIQTMMGVEGMAQQMTAGLDPTGLFTHWAQMTGAKDIFEFAKRSGGQMPNLQPQILPDEQVANMAADGELADLEAAAAGML